MSNDQDPEDLEFDPELHDPECIQEMLEQNFQEEREEDPDRKHIPVNDMEEEGFENGTFGTSPDITEEI